MVTNIEVDHHAAYASEAELRAFFDELVGGGPARSSGAGSSSPVALELAIPGAHNRQNAAAALAVLDLAGVPRGESEAAIARFTGAARRLELVGDARRA